MNSIHPEYLFLIFLENILREKSYYRYPHRWNYVSNINKDELDFIEIGFVSIKMKSFKVRMIEIINKHLNKNIQKENQN